MTWPLNFLRRNSFAKFVQWGGAPACCHQYPFLVAPSLYKFGEGVHPQEIQWSGHQSRNPNLLASLFPWSQSVKLSILGRSTEGCVQGTAEEYWRSNSVCESLCSDTCNFNDIRTRALYRGRLYMPMHADYSASPTQLGHSGTFRHFNWKYSIKNELYDYNNFIDISIESIPNMCKSIKFCYRSIYIYSKYL